MTWRVLVFFPIILFLLIRQLYANLLGVNRDLLTVLLLTSLTLLGMIVFVMRLHEHRGDLLLVDVVTILQFLIAAIGIWIYMVVARIAPSEAGNSLFYYCLAPFLIYAGFLLCRLSEKTIRAALVAAGLAYAVTTWVTVCEVFNIDSPLFAYDRWELQKNYFGIARASGLYGTQIDYGCLSFFVFTVAFYLNIQRPNWFAKIIILLASLGALASMSRVALAAIALVVITNVFFGRSLKKRLRLLLVLAVIVATLYPIADELGAMSVIASDDPYTQQSNESRLEAAARLPHWLLRDYLITGTGPGTQNGPDVRNQKFVSDFLWLGFIVDFGTLIGGPLVLCRLLLIAYLVFRCLRSTGDQGLRWTTTALSIGFFVASFVDSAYAHLVTVSIFYMIAGCFLYCDRPNQVPLVEECS